MWLLINQVGLFLTIILFHSTLLSLFFLIANRDQVRDITLKSRAGAPLEDTNSHEMFIKVNILVCLNLQGYMQHLWRPI